MSEIWIVAEHGEKGVTSLAHELVKAAKLIGGGAAVKAVLLTGPGSPVAAQSGLAVSGIIQAEHAQLATFTADGYARVLVDLARARKPKAILLGHTTTGLSVAPILAHRLGTGCVTNVTGIQPDGGALVVERATYNRKIMSRERLKTPEPWILTVQEGAFAAEAKAPAAAPIEKASVTLGPQDIRWAAEPAETQAKGDVDISEAKIVIAAGRGLQKKENVVLVEKLAKVLGGVTAGSRPVVDDNWLPRDRQVGTSGKTVKPDLYLAVGISGAIQHIVGMKGSRCIVAINKDPDAPIFSVAHYGIVGDLFEVVPAMTELLAAAK